MKKDELMEDQLHAYILGELSADETKVLEKKLEQNQELNKLYISIQDSYEKIAFENAVEPPNQVKENLFDQINSEQTEQPKKTLTKPRNYFYYAAACAAIFMVVSAILFNQLLKNKESYQELQTQISDLEKNNQSLEKDNTKFDKILKSKPLQISGKFSLNAYWNESDQTAWVNTNQLPEISAQEDYQIWADVEGEMISMGVLKPKQDLAELAVPKNAESFNITIEPLGGSEEPNTQRLVANVIL